MQLYLRNNLKSVKAVLLNFENCQYAGAGWISCNLCPTDQLTIEPPLMTAQPLSTKRILHQTEGLFTLQSEQLVMTGTLKSIM